MATAISDQGAEVRAFRLAAVFDVVDPITGPAFTDDHPVIEDERELSWLLDYLDAGVPILTTPTLMDDVVEPARGAVVPLNFRTDGEWIWTDTVNYYLEEYGLAPEPELLAHLRGRAGFSWQPDQETVQQAVAFVMSPPEDEDDEPVWRTG
ncbi:hypothetical protein [Streptacidiphilus fuscans]|uniref:hypothetical protein n=1 Tax=Streptacidiphilus fuscans TaxID=2789292 RepID=UPI001C0732BC|nr:hypothetical protein [Streptacidiphilus fuscans]